MTAHRITDTDLPLVSDIIDAVAVASTGDTHPVALLAERLTPEQAARAVGLLVGIAAGCLDQLTAATGVDHHALIKLIRRRAAG